MCQDQVYYALYCALRPDQQWRLTQISYPYYTKYALPGASTGFKHIDKRVEDLLEQPRQRNMIQGTVSLDNEDQSNCTILVLGFHKHITTWYQDCVVN